jgi:regulatory protein
MEDTQRAGERGGTVTRVTALPRHPGRFAVELDGGAGLTVDEDLLLRYDIQVGDQLDGSRVADILAHEETARATEAALVYLAHRPRSEREVRDRLRRGDFPSETIEKVIARLHDWRYLDDADFARRWVENRAAHRPRGRRLLQQELRRKGIAAETVNEVIAEADLDELAAATELARRRLGTTTGDDPIAARRRLGAYLARRGYSYDVVRVALERALGEAEEFDETIG